MSNTTYVRIGLQERIADIEKEIRGVVGMYNVTQFEIDVMNSLKKMCVGSIKQLRVLEKIEIKVFGYSREREEAKHERSVQKSVSA